MLLDCDTADQGCHGGDPDNAYAYMAKNGIDTFVYVPYTLGVLTVSVLCILSRNHLGNVCTIRSSGT